MNKKKTEIKHHLKDLYRVKESETSRMGCLRLDMNEGVPGLPEDFVKEVLSGIAPEYLAVYPEYRRLAEKIAAHNNLSPENIILSNGSDAAIKYTFDAYVSSQDRVLLTDPTFAMYPVYCEMFGAKPVIVEYKADLSFPVEDFIKRISGDIKLAVIVNPNNPTGSAAGREALTSIIKKARDNNVLTIVDEAYFYFYPDSVIEEVKRYNNLIVLRTFSKLCGMASVRAGYAAASPEIIESLRKVKPSYDVNGLAVLFAEKMLDKPGIIRDLIASANKGKEYLIRRLSEKGIGHKEGLANFVLIRCGDRVEEVKKKLEEKGILVSGGFRQSFLKDYIRVTTGGTAVMKRFWDAFIDIWSA